MNPSVVGLFGCSYWGQVIIVRSYAGARRKSEKHVHCECVLQSSFHSVPFESVSALRLIFEPDKIQGPCFGMKGCHSLLVGRFGGNIILRSSLSEIITACMEIA